MIAVQVDCIVYDMVWKMIMVKAAWYWGGELGGKGKRMNGTW